MSGDNVWSLSDYADTGKSFDESEYDKDQKRKAAIAEFDAAALEAEQDFGLIPEEFAAKPERVEVDPAIKMPLDVSEVDLNRPPGFVGQVVDWIDSQCRYPRRRIAVASGLCAIGNIGGMSHVDQLDGVTANMLAFCVAASSTGKEAVMQAFIELHMAAGVHGALQGGIKSEQEIVRNLIENQSAFYTIDEIGIFLGKVRNAQKRGGASYLEGVFGLIMSAYSKANSRMPLGGDIKRDLRKLYAGMLSRAQDDGDDEAEKRASRLLAMVDNGLERPFLSVVGFTTPSTFDGIMDGETATQGFVGRSIIVNERDINPSAREGFKKPDIPIMMAGRLGLIYAGEEGQGRVEYVGSRKPIDTTQEAEAALLDVSRWLIGYAEYMGERTGEASVAMIRRGYELVAKISFILAIPEGTRTLEHVLWALAYVKDELDYKVQLVFANDNQSKDPEAALRARLMGFIDRDSGLTTSVLANKVRVDKATIEGVMTALETVGSVIRVDLKRKYKGKPVSVWKIAQ